MSLPFYQSEFRATHKGFARFSPEASNALMPEDRKDPTTSSRPITSALRPPMIYGAWARAAIVPRFLARHSARLVIRSQLEVVFSSYISLYLEITVRNGASNGLL
ncbi:hypothetical protein [Sulfitobacter sp. EhC04]|uniref:hypothetical protein n=1 Tax=Sulfitobacter sp. EhC04 TaxID=1849168 RepID=UPI001372C08D|nr:hypothetical protein [Sulfitobacter sp. EhC04]